MIARAGVHRANTVKTSAAEAQQAIDAASQAPEPEVVTEQYQATPAMPSEPKVIYARYLRGGNWVPVRVGALSLKGAALLTGALPRLQDRVDIALDVRRARALVRGAVGKVSTGREAQATGAATFSRGVRARRGIEETADRAADRGARSEGDY